MVNRDRHGHQPTPTLWDTVRSDGAPDDCFADETAIDFPSVDHLLERERAAFLNERGADTLTTEVSLSRRDASNGIVLPLEVPLRGTCRSCGGRGETWTEPCADCNGTGNALVHHPVNLALPAGVADGARFRFRVTSPHAAPVRVEVRVAIRSSAA
jgi:hypothetical protein